MTAPEQGPAWVPCPGCGGFWCRIHDRHADECPCPPIEDWKDGVDPYSSGGPPGEVLT